MPTFKKIERLCSKKAIDILFSKGKSINQYPLKLIYRISDFESEFPARAMFVVPKKKHKRANKRNTIKRRMREVYRLNKELFYRSIPETKIDLMFICLSSEEISYQEIDQSVRTLLHELQKKIISQKTN